MNKKPVSLPEFLKGVLWSYNLKHLDAQRDFKRIATNILIFGDIKETSWLLDNFSTEQIISVITNPLKGEWDAKSLAFWCSYFNVSTDKKKALKSFLNP